MAGLLNNWFKKKNNTVNTGIPNEVKNRMVNASANANAFLDTVPEGYHSFTIGKQPSVFDNRQSYNQDLSAIKENYYKNDYVGNLPEPQADLSFLNEGKYKSNSYNLLGVNAGSLDKNGINGNTYTDYSTGNVYNINSKGNLVMQDTNVIPIERQEEQLDDNDINEQSAIDAYSKSGKQKNNFFESKGGQALNMGLMAGSSLMNHAFNESMSDNQKAIYSQGIFGKNAFLDNVTGINKSINATNANDWQSQMRNKEKQINQYKTDKLTTGQQALNVGSGVASGFAEGMQTGNIYAAIGMAALKGGKNLANGLKANNSISDVNDAVRFARTGLNNSGLAAMQNIHKLESNNKKMDMYNNSPYMANGGYLYANGGLMNPYGINEFNNGKTHEQNPYGGIPVSIAEDGKPNLVEEGEVLYDDYVYSNRIKINDTIRRRLKLKDSTKTFADAAKEVKERGDDRPNDPVTEKTIKAQMQFLKSEQDKKKEQQEEREQQKMLAQMNEQQLQAMQEQQMNEEADAYEQQMAEEQMAQQAQQEQIANPQMQEQMMAQQQQPQQQMFANGGNLKGGSDDADAHRFAQKVTTDKTKRKENSNLGKSRKEFIKKNIDAIINNTELSNKEKQQRIKDFVTRVNEYQDSHQKISTEIGDNWNVENEGVRSVQNTWAGFDGANDDIIGANFEVGEGGITGDSATTWTTDGIWGNQTREGRTFGTRNSDFTPEDLTEINDYLKEHGYEYGLDDNGYYKFKELQPETPPEEPKGYRGGEEIDPNYTWKYKQNYIPLGIDAALAAQSFAPADYSRANSIINTPIRDIQYKPIGGKIAPYIIDPRLQYQMNADLGAATNRGLINNAGGNSAAAQAALLANNRQISQSASNLGYQADAQNAAQIQAARQFNSQIDQTNSQGFLEAARANQAADVQRGEFNYYGQNMKENIDAKRGEAISNSMQSLADDSMKLSKDRYNQGMMAGLVDSGYFGEPTPFLRQQTGWNPNGTFTRNNYLIDDNGNKHYIVNNADGTVAFANPNDDLISKNQGKKLVFNNGEYKFVG
jgi:hypothetical protein